MQIVGARRLGRVVIALALLSAATVYAGASPVQKCRAAKNKIAGQYAACRQNAESKRATSGDEAKYAVAAAKCTTKFTTAWQKAIAKATKANAACLDAPLTDLAFQEAIDDATANVAGGLAGLGLANCGADLAACTDDLDMCATDLAACEALPSSRLVQTGQTGCWNEAGTAIGCAGSGQDGELQTGLARALVDNGDGTITDTRTGLMWEKHSDDGGLHDKDNTYTWANAFAVKIAGLNAGGGFAGHTDWRLPNVHELRTLTDFSTYNPGVPPVFNTACVATCVVTACSCTRAGNHWSSTTHASFHGFAWIIDATGGTTFHEFKPTALFVRAVRGGA